MNLDWQLINTTSQKHSNRWGHSSCALPNNQLAIYGGYADNKYFNDVWVYTASKNQWIQVKIPQGKCRPVARSNSSLFYCQSRQAIMMFGGGYTDNSRFNDLWMLNIQSQEQSNLLNGCWVQLETLSEKLPWARTYHITQKYHQFIIIQGGQSYGTQIQDIWALNLLTLIWVQIKTEKPCEARKFHSSCMINDKLFIIGGIQGDYKSINKIQYINLELLRSNPVQKIKHIQFKWNQIQLICKQSISIARWGHVSKAFNHKIFIFGGRTYMQHNDLLMIDLKTNIIKRMITTKAPQARRRPCCWLMGSFFVIDSGYNGKYLNDQLSLDLRFTSQLNSIQQASVNKIQYKRQICDIHINTADNQYIHMCSPLIKSSFMNPDDMIMFLQQLGQMKLSKASKYAQIINNGVFFNQQTRDQELGFLSSKSIGLKEDPYQQIDQDLLKKYKITYSTNTLLANKKKILFNVVKKNVLTNFNPFKSIKVSRQQFIQIINNIQNDIYSDTLIECLDDNQNIQKRRRFIKCSKNLLSSRSQYFKNIFSIVQKPLSKPITQQGKKLAILQTYMKIIIIYCSYGHMIIPQSFKLKDFFFLFKICKKYSLKEIMHICIEEIKDHILQKQLWEYISKYVQVVINNQLQQRNHQNILKQQCFQVFLQVFSYCLKESYNVSHLNCMNDQINNSGNQKWRLILQIIQNKIVDEILEHFKKSQLLNIQNNSSIIRSNIKQKTQKTNNQSFKSKLPIKVIKKKMNFDQNDKQNNMTQSIIINQRQLKAQAVNKGVNQIIKPQAKANRYSQSSHAFISPEAKNLQQFIEHLLNYVIKPFISPSVLTQKLPFLNKNQQKCISQNQLMKKIVMKEKQLSEFKIVLSLSKVNHISI